MESKAGRLLGHTAAFAVSQAECAVLAEQMKRQTLKSVRISTVKYQVFYHSPLARMVGQVPQACSCRTDTSKHKCVYVCVCA